MSEKRFRVGLDDVYFNCIEDFVFDAEVDCMIDNAEVVDLLNEQQATISQLQDLCGKSDYENAKLRLKNKELQDKIDHLCEKFDKCKMLKEENEQLKYDNLMFKQIIKNFQKVAQTDKRRLEDENEQLRFALRTEQALARVEKDNRPFLSKEEFLKELENE